MSGLTGTTVVQLRGDALHLIEEACSVARSLQPAVLVVEDVDLVAQDRDLASGPCPLLFQLLNELDGLSEGQRRGVRAHDEPRRPAGAGSRRAAGAGRPGRRAHPARRRRATPLFELYRGGLAVDTTRLDDVIDRTEGATASFIKELLRRSALMAAERDAGRPLTAHLPRLRP